MKPAALELRGVTRHFGSVVALDTASLAVARGSVHALLGENGAGKTTMMRIAFGLLQPNSGETLVDGAVREFRSPSEAIAAGIGMVQQHPANVGPMSVWENVALGGAGPLNPRHIRNDVGSVAARLGFRLDPDAIVADLPVAAQQRLEILKAIHRKASILILDEPTAILAPEEAKELYTWLRGFAADGGTAVVITHKLDEAQRFTDELTVLRGGRTVLTGSSGTATVAALTTAMIGEATAALPFDAIRHGPGDMIFRAQEMVLHDARRGVVIESASFEVRRGEVVGIAGVEGSGHHELLLGIAGRKVVASGSRIAPDVVSFVPEDRHQDGVVLEFSLSENVAIRGAGSRRGSIGWSSVAAHTERLMKQFDVRARGASAPVRSLSGGNQQKLVLARELDGDPPLVVAENPTRGLDIRASAFVRERLRAARDGGAGVVVYSSDLDELLEISDRVLVVHGGRVREVSLNRTEIGAAMLGVA